MKTEPLVRPQLAEEKRAAFTVVDLMVVVATIGILAILVPPALAVPKTDSTGFQCENNLRQLAMAWTMYADANSDKLVSLSTYQSGGALVASIDVPWRSQTSLVTVPVPPEITAKGPAAVQKYKIEMGYKQPAKAVGGPLYPYAPHADIIHCPSDFRFNLKIGSGYSWDSYGGSGNLHGEIGGYTKRSQMLHPSGRFIWAESADMRGEVLGSWEMANDGVRVGTNLNLTAAAFSDSPAAFHIGAANFNFCDGHVERHQWQSPLTIAFANDTTVGKDDGTGRAAQQGQAAGNPDAMWVAAHYAGPKNP